MTPDNPIAPRVKKDSKAGTICLHGDDDPIKAGETGLGKPDPVAALMSVAMTGVGPPQPLSVDASAAATGQYHQGESKSSAADSAIRPSLQSQATRLAVPPPGPDTFGDGVSPTNGAAPFSAQLSLISRQAVVQTPPSAAVTDPTPSGRTGDFTGSGVNTASAADFASNPPVMAKDGSIGTGETPPPASVNLACASPTSAAPQQASDSVTRLARADKPSVLPPDSTYDTPAIPSDTRFVAVTQSTTATPLTAITPSGGRKPEEIAAQAAMQEPTTPVDAGSDSDESPHDAVLNPYGQQVKRNSPFVGISSAQSSAAMRKPAESSAAVRLGSTADADVFGNAAVGPVPAGAAAPFTVARPPSQSAPTAEPTLPHAVAAVEAALDAVERVRDAGHSSVELKLSFGDDTRLAVRVELRDGAVHTTFRTDSADLRQALANQWRETVPATFAATPNRALRVAEPVFTTASGSLDTTGSPTGGEANSRHAATPDSAPELFRHPASRSPAATAPGAAAPSVALPHSTSVRLNAFA
jgi:hypothetical protein